jgi:hypothetical protein
LKDTICTAVMITKIYTWPMNRAAKKPPIMTKVQNVRVMKLAFFFSYSDCCSSAVGGFWADVCQLRDGGRLCPVRRTSWMFSRVPLGLVLVGEPSSLTSLKLRRRPSDCPLECCLVWGNLTPRRDRPVMSALTACCVGCFSLGRCQWH